MARPDHPPAGTALPPALRRMEDMLGFQRRSWRAQRFAWLGLLVLLAVGFSGGFGGAGWLAEAEAVTPDGALRIVYHRIQRHGRPSTVRIESLRPPADGGLDVRLGPQLAVNWQVQTLLPPPRASRWAAEGLVLSLTVSGPGEAPALLLEMEPKAIGLLRLGIGTAAGLPVTLCILVWP